MAMIPEEMEDLRSDLARLMRSPMLSAMEQWGFSRPSKIDFMWSIEVQSIIVRVRWGKWVVSHYVDEAHVDLLFYTSFVEMLAQDANVPIAEEL